MAFDLDGTLVDTASFGIDALVNAIQAVNRAHGFSLAIPESDNVTSAFGGLASAFYRSLLMPWSPLIERLVHEETMRQQKALLVAGRGRLYPGAAECLRAVRAMGYGCCVVSHASIRYVHQVRAALFEPGLIDAWYSSIPFGGRKCAALARHAELSKRTCVAMVGDRRDDMDAAEAVGASGIGCLFGYGRAHEMRHAAAAVAQPGNLFSTLRSVLVGGRNVT